MFPYLHIQDGTLDLIQQIFNENIFVFISRNTVFQKKKFTVLNSLYCKHYFDIVIQVKNIRSVFLVATIFFNYANTRIWAIISFFPNEAWCNQKSVRFQGIEEHHAEGINV